MTASIDDFFHSRLAQMIDLRHPLAVLAKRMPLQEIEAYFACSFARKPRPAIRLKIWTAWTSLALLFNSKVLAYERAGAKRRLGSTSSAWPFLITAGLASPPCWSTSASSLAKRALKKCWPVSREGPLF